MPYQFWEISIPSGSIKSLFQSNCNPLKVISIPSGSIKSDILSSIQPNLTTFQFLLVQLKDTRHQL